MKIEDVLNAYPSRLGEAEVTDSDKLRDLREWAESAASTIREAANEIASKELARERAQREANEASGIARERGKKLIAVEGTLRNAGVPMDDRTHDEGVAWLVTKCEQLCRMHDGVSADLDRERREHQEAMAEAAARELKLTEELEAARFNRDEAMRQRGAFMEQRDKAIRDAEFFKGEAEAAVRAIIKAQITELHERLASPKRRSKPKTTKKPKAAAKRSRRKP